MTAVWWFRYRFFHNVVTQSLCSLTAVWSTGMREDCLEIWKLVLVNWRGSLWFRGQRLFKPSVARQSPGYSERERIRRELFCGIKVRLEFGGRRPRGRVFGSRRSSSAASAPARLSPGPCRQVSDSSSHEINSAWNLQSATLPLLRLSYNENTPSIQSSHMKYWQSFLTFRNTLSHVTATQSGHCLFPCLDLATRSSRLSFV